MVDRQTAVIVATLVVMTATLALILGLSLGLRKKATSSPDFGNSLKYLYDRGNGRERNALATSGNYQHLSVQSEHIVCSRIGTDVLVSKYGTAVDAAVATLLCLGVVNFHGIGIGGGHFMTVYDAPRGSKDRTVETITAREVLPKAGHRDTFKNVSSIDGGTAVGVPGEVKGLHAAWQKFGRVSWKELVEPAARLATDGFVIENALDSAIQSKQDRIRENAGLRDLLVKSDGKLYKKGDVLKRPKYGETLRRIGKDPFSFYSGSLADDVIADIRDEGGIMTKDDLLDYTVKVRDPVKGRLDGARLTMHSPQPPSSGVILQFILRILDGLNLTRADVSTKAKAATTYHRLIETFKWAYAKRSRLGDPDFVDVGELISNLTSKSLIDDVRAKLDPERTWPVDHYNPLFETAEDSGTAHLNVLAPYGGAVALTSSINTFFGSAVRGSRTGIIFNNQLDDFSVPGTVNSYGFSPSPSNYPEAGKMPMSSMSPSIFLADDGTVAYMSGAAGGSRIISSVAYVALHNLYLGQSLKDATRTPRLHHQLLPNEISYEDGFDKDILRRLEDLGHQTKLVPPTRSSVGTIRNTCATCRSRQCTRSCIHAASDPRRGRSGPSGF